MKSTLDLTLFELKVRSWPDVEKEVYVSVRADLVSQVLFKAFMKSLAETI